MTDTPNSDKLFRSRGWEERDILAAQIFDREQELRLQTKDDPTNPFHNGAMLGLQMARDIVTGENL